MRKLLFDKIGSNGLAVTTAVEVCAAGSQQGMRGPFVQRMRALGGSGKWASTPYVVVIVLLFCFLFSAVCCYY